MNDQELRPVSSSAIESIDELENTIAEWMVRRADGIAEDQDEQFQQWLLADPRRAAILRRLENTWRTLNEPRHLGYANDVLQQVALRERRRRRRWQVRRPVAFAAVAAALLLVVAHTDLAQKYVWGNAEATIFHRPDIQVLQDGSRVELNMGAEVEVNFTPNKRNVRLIKGEGMFTIAKDKTRPFFVKAADVEIVAVGTAFSASLVTNQVNVLVTEGQVKVTELNHDSLRASDQTRSETKFERLSDAKATEDGGNEIVLDRSMQATIPLKLSSEAPTAALKPVIVVQSEKDIDAALAWRKSRIEFAGTTLAEAVAYFNRHNRVHIVIADPSKRSAQITGIYWLNDPKGFVRLLESTFNVRSEMAGNSIVLH